MKKYTIYFEIFGKKMKTVVFAESEEKAKFILLDKVVFHKIESEKIYNSNPFDDLFSSFFKNK
jgi:hypothetical protein